MIAPREAAAPCDECELRRRGNCDALNNATINDISGIYLYTRIYGCIQPDREKMLDEYNDELLTKLVQELAGTWRMRDAKLFQIIRKYRRVPIGAMKEYPVDKVKQS